VLSCARCVEDGEALTTEIGVTASWLAQFFSESRRYCELLFMVGVGQSAGGGDDGGALVGRKLICPSRKERGAVANVPLSAVFLSP
jgi:hypothetical protein